MHCGYRILVKVIIAVLKQLKQLQRKSRENIQRIQTHVLHDTGAILFQLSYEASLEAAQERVQFIPVI